MNFNIEMSSRYPESRSRELLRAEDKAQVDAIRSRIGRAAWPFLVGASRAPDARPCQDVLAGEPSFSS